MPQSVDYFKDNFLVKLDDISPMGSSELSFGGLVGRISITDFNEKKNSKPIFSHDFLFLLYNGDGFFDIIKSFNPFIPSNVLLDSITHLIKAFEPCEYYTDSLRKLYNLSDFNPDIHAINIAEHKVIPSEDYILPSSFFPPFYNLTGNLVYIKNGIRIDMFNIKNVKELDSMFFGELRLSEVRNRNYLTRLFPRRTLPLDNPEETLQYALEECDNVVSKVYFDFWKNYMIEAMLPINKYANEIRGKAFSDYASLSAEQKVRRAGFFEPRVIHSNAIIPTLNDLKSCMNLGYGGDNCLN